MSCGLAQELEGMEAAVAKIKEEARLNAEQKAAAVAEVSRLEALVAQLKQQPSKGAAAADDRVSSCLTPAQMYCTQ